MLLKHYKLKNVVLYKQGVGEKNEWHKFSVPVTDFGAISAGRAHFGERDDNREGKEIHARFTRHEEVDCEVIALDSLLNNFSTFKFIKIDIEGAEYYAFKGMRKTVEKFKAVILMEINPFFTYAMWSYDKKDGAVASLRQSKFIQANKKIIGKVLRGLGLSKKSRCEHSGVF